MNEKEPGELVTSSRPGEFLQYGGQAVIEGVMMRSPRFFAVACRKPNGEIVVRREPVDKGILGKLQWLNRPLLRGTLALVDAMALGARALAYASNVQLSAEQEKNAADAAEKGDPVKAGSRINDIAIGGTLVTGLAFGLCVFVLLPTAITGLLVYLHLLPAAGAHSGMWLNLIDGLIRMVIFFGYIGLISAMPQIREVFKYHGAEHKAINTLEAGLPLTSASAAGSSRIHPRCGTSFIFIVLVINLIVFAVLPRPANFIYRFGLHLAVIPLVAGIAYEVIKFAGKYRGNPLVMAVFAPGMWTQYLTTREPEERHLDVALASLIDVLQAEGHMPEGSEIGAIDPVEPAAAIA